MAPAPRHRCERLEPRVLLATVIHSGRSVTDNLGAAGDEDVFVFTAQVGQAFNLAMGELPGATAIAPRLELYDPFGTLLASDAGTSVAFVARTATVAGEYEVVARDNAAAATGNYSLDFALVPGPQGPDPDGDGGAIASGESFTRTLDRAGDLDVYTFAAGAGDTINAAMGELPGATLIAPRLELYDPGGALLLAHAGAGVGFVDNIVVSAPGTYYLVARDNAAIATGDYTINLAVTPGPHAPDPQDDGGTITSGQDVIATLDHAGDMDLYTFAAEAGDNLTVTMGEVAGAAGVTPRIELYDPAGRLLAADASATVGFVNQVAGMTGTYTAIARDNPAVATGDYAVSLAVVPGAQSAGGSGDGGVVASGQQVMATLSNAGDLDIYRFEAKAGDTVNASMGELPTALAISPRLDLYDPNGVLLASSATAAVAMIANVTARSAGTHYLVARDNAATATGGYSFNFALAPAAQAVDADGDGGAIASGQTANATLDRAGDLDIYTIAATAGDTFNVSMGELPAALGVSPRLDLFDPFGRLLSSSATASLAYLDNIVARFTGTYTVVARDNGAAATGDYTLNLSLVPGSQAADPDGDGGTLAPGPAVTRTLDRTGDLDVYTFTVNDGDAFTVTMQEVAGALGVSPYLDLYDPFGALLTSVGTATIAQVGPRAAGVGGTYYVVARDTAGVASGDYTIALSVTPAAGGLQATLGAGGDNVYLRRHPTDPAMVDAWVNAATPGQGAPSITVARSGVAVLDLLGGNNALTLDVSNGAPLPASASLVGGPGQNDALAVVGNAAANDFAFTPTSVLAVVPLGYGGFESLSFEGRGGGDRATIIGRDVTLAGAVIDLESLHVTDGLATLPAGRTSPMITRELVLDDGGTLDLNDNEVIVNYSGASPIGSWDGVTSSGLFGRVVSGRNGGTWNGDGIITSTPDALGGMTTVGIAEASTALALDAGETRVWNGVTVDATTVLLKYTYAGDANLDGAITGDDYSAIDLAILFPGATGYWNGDFNFDGVITGDDYSVIDLNILLQGVPL